MKNAIEWVLEIAERNAGREFLKDTVTGETLSFGKLHEHACAIASELRGMGLRKGDRLVLLLNNSASFAKLYFACLYSGVVAVPVNPILSAKEIDYIIAHSGAKTLVFSPETHPQCEGLAKSGKFGAVCLLDGRKDSALKDGVKAWSVREPKGSGPFAPFEGVSPDDSMTIVYTSGTTASPQGVAHRISDMIDNAWAFNKRMGIGPDNRFYGILAMSYLGGYYNLLMLPFAAGASVVLSNAFDPKAAILFWETASSGGVNTLWLVPTIISILMEIDRGDKGERYCRESVRLGLVGTAPLPVRLRHSFESRYGLRLYENYGLSETFFISTNCPSFPVLDGSVGRLLPGVEVSIRDSDGKTLDYGREGEMHVCTPWLMEGYYNPEKGSPDKLLSGEFFATGDVGVMSPTGELFITGRKKDLIIRGGINVSPASIENVIASHPSVSECAVVGVPHAVYGEDIAAVVKLVPGAPFDKVKAELTESFKTALGAFKRPAALLELESFPKSSSGKIQKRKVKELLIERLKLSGVLESQKAAPKGPAPKTYVPGRIVRNAERAPKELVERLSKFPASVVSDSMNRFGMMDASMKPLAPGHRFCGTALTVEETEAGNLMSHAALDLIQPGDVLVIDAKGSMTRSCWGGLQTLKAKMAGAAAIVIYGTARDFDEIVSLGLPVYALGLSPGGPLKGWGGNVNRPISCAGTPVLPGDIVIGDDDGVVVVPKDIAVEVAECCEVRAGMEKEWFKRVEGGESTLDVVGLRGKLSEFKTQYI